MARGCRYFTPLAFIACVVTFFAGAQADRWNDLNAQATQLANQGRFMEALPVAQQALQESISTFGTRSPNYGMSLNAVGYLQTMVGNFADAEKNLKESESVIRSASGPDSQQLLFPLGNLANLYTTQAQASGGSSSSTELLAKAEQYAREALTLAQKLHPGDDPALVALLQGMARICALEQRNAEAITYLRRSLKIEGNSLPPNHVQIIRTRTELAWTLGQTGDQNGAMEQYRLALASAEATLGPNDPVTQGIREDLNRLSAASTTGNSNVVSGLLNMLPQVIQDGARQFQSYRTGSKELIDGDQLWKATPLPGMQSCEIWVYRDRSLGSRYSCVVGIYSNNEEAARDFKTLRQALQAKFPDWKARDRGAGNPNFVITNDNLHCHIGIRYVLDSGRYRLHLSVDHDL